MGTVSKFEALNRRLDSWKEIASFFGCDERTVKRWEKERGLPVHRLPGVGRGKVFAYSDELAEWLKGPKPSVVSAPSSANPNPTSGPRPGSDLGIPDPGDAPPSEIPKAGILSSDSQGSSSPGIHITSHAAPYEPILGVTAPPGTRKVWFFALPILALILAALLLRPHGSAATNFGSHSISNGGASTERHPANPEAEDLYLKGRFYWGKRTAESLNQAVDYFTQAIVHDPNYAPAYVGLADCYNLLREYAVMQDKEAYPRSLAAAKKAVELDDTLAEAHRSLAFGEYYWNWNTDAANREFKRAIELDPGNATAHQWYGNVLVQEGYFQEALAELEQARKLDPSSRSILADSAEDMFIAGQHQPAIESLQQMEATDPDFLSPHRYLAWMYFQMHDYPGAFAESGKFATLLHDKDAIALAEAEEQSFAAGGEPAMRRTMAQKQEELYRQNRGGAYPVAAAYAKLDKKSEALHYLQIAFDRREMGMLSLKRDQDFATLQGDPAFRDLLAKVGPQKPKE